MGGVLEEKMGAVWLTEMEETRITPWGRGEGSWSNEVCRLLSWSSAAGVSILGVDYVCRIWHSDLKCHKCDKWGIVSHVYTRSIPDMCDIQECSVSSA